MTFNFCRKVFSIGSGDVQFPLQFYKKGFELTSNGTSPSWRDIILSGNTALTLANAKADGLNYVKLFGGTEQNGTPTPTTPMDIVSNNGVVKARHQSGLPLGYTLLDYIESTGTQWIDTGIVPDNDTGFNTIQVKSGVLNFSRSQEGGINIGNGVIFNFTADGNPVYIKTNGKCSLSIL